MFAHSRQLIATLHAAVNAKLTFAERLKAIDEVVNKQPTTIAGGGESNPADQENHDLIRILATNFDETWYNERYQLGDGKLNGFAHYLGVGIDAGYSPNAAYNETYYLKTNPDVADAIRNGSYRCGYEHFVRCGRHELRAAMPREALMSGRSWSYLSAFFDEAWYDRQYDLTAADLCGFDHYLRKGARIGYSPSENFDEQFYVSFYRDVSQSVKEGRFISGFEHYVIAGRFEDRIPKFSSEKALDSKFPGLTSPIGVDVAAALMARIRSLPARRGTGEPAVWFLLPCLNPDIFFGGYKCALELIRAFVRRGQPLNIVICSDEDDGNYGLWRLGKDSIWSALRKVHIFCRNKLEDPLEIGPNDRVIAYSTWEAYLAHELVKLTDHPVFGLLVQEYEPIFRTGLSTR